MSLVRPAGESDFESNDEDELYDELCDQPSRGTAKEQIGRTESVMPEPIHSANPPEAASEQRNPMILHDMQTAISTGNVAAVERLLEKVDSPNVLLNSGWPLIVHAAYFCHHSIIQLLIKHGANVNAVNDTGDTALHAACKSGIDLQSESIVKTVADLVSFGANLDAKDFNGRTPLMYACRRNLTNIVKYLLEPGTPHKRIFSRDDKDWNCIDWCAIFGNIECLKLIINTLQIKIDPKKFLSSKLWPNHVFEFLQISNQEIDMEVNQATSNHSLMEIGVGGKSSDNATTARKSSKDDGDCNPSAVMDTDKPDRPHLMCRPTIKSNEPVDENIGDTNHVNQAINQTSCDIEMKAANATSDPSALVKSSVQGNSLLDCMEDEDEECILPAVIKRDTKKVEEYLKYVYCLMVGVLGKNKRFLFQVLT